MSLNRRGFLTMSGVATLSAATASAGVARYVGRQLINPQHKPKIKLGISTYSYWRFKGNKPSIESIIDKSALLGVDFVDVLPEMLASENASYLLGLKKYAFETGISLVNLSIQNDFAFPHNSPEFKKNFEHVVKSIKQAYLMGMSSIRVNPGGYDEATIKRYTEDELFKWTIDGYKKLLPIAKEHGIMLLLENHWGLGESPEGMIRILEGVNSEWFRFMADFGNFKENPYDKLRKIAPLTRMLSSKTYDGGGIFYTLNLDYERIIRMFKDVDFTGYLTIEYEGSDNPETAIPKAVSMLRALIDKVYV